MPFKMSDLSETPEQEAARLAEAPVGSKNHFLSGLPINMQGWIEGKIIKLPGEDRSTIVVVPIKYTGGDNKDCKPLRLHDGWWECIVVYSEIRNSSPRGFNYPVGGYHLSIPTAELVRGTEIQLKLDRKE